MPSGLSVTHKLKSLTTSVVIGEILSKEKEEEKSKQIEGRLAHRADSHASIFLENHTVFLAMRVVVCQKKKKEKENIL